MSGDTAVAVGQVDLSPWAGWQADGPLVWCPEIAADSLIARYAALEPDEPNPRDSRGEILERAGEYEKAREQYREALEIEPTFVFALDHLARSYLREGRATEARAELETYLPGPNPEVSARLHVLIGDTYTVEGGFEEAARSYQEAEEIGVGESLSQIRIEGLASLGWLQLFTGRYEESDQTASILYGIDPYNSTALRLAISSAR